MVILTTSINAQTFLVIPRSPIAAVTFELTDKSKRTTVPVTVAVSNSNGYMTVVGAFVDGQNKPLMIAQRFYSFAIKNGNVIIFRGTIFCTDQTNFNIFDINAGVYTTENTYNNDFVII